MNEITTRKLTEIVPALGDDEIVQMLADVRAKEAQVLTKVLGPIRVDKAILEAELAMRIHANGGTQIPNPDYVVELEIQTEYTKRIDVLRGLEQISDLPKDELSKALYLEVPEPEWIANTVRLKALAKRYGGKIAEIIDAGLVKQQKGIPKLKITPREKMQLASATSLELAA